MFAGPRVGILTQRKSGILTRSNVTNNTDTPFIGLDASVAMTTSPASALSVPSAAVQWGTLDYCLEGFVKISSFGGNYTQIYSDGANWTLYCNHLSLGSGQWVCQTVSNSGLGATTLNAWLHFAATKQGTTTRFFVQGALLGTGSSGGASLNGNSSASFGFGTGGNCPNCLFSNLRIVVGSPVYTSAFTAPTKPLEVIPGTRYLYRSPYGTNYFTE
jgi:hypothetical protein